MKISLFNRSRPRFRTMLKSGWCRWRACRATLRGKLATYEEATLRGKLATYKEAQRSCYKLRCALFDLIRLRTVGLAAWLALAFFVSGCGNAAQQKAYEHAALAERQLTAENAAAIIAEYKQVIALQPDSEWAQKARVRITAVDTKVKAEELHKSVFQEHGVD